MGTCCVLPVPSTCVSYCCLSLVSPWKQGLCSWCGASPESKVWGDCIRERRTEETEDRKIQSPFTPLSLILQTFSAVCFLHGAAANPKREAAAAGGETIWMFKPAFKQDFRVSYSQHKAWDGGKNQIQMHHRPVLNQSWVRFTGWLQLHDHTSD